MIGTPCKVGKIYTDCPRQIRTHIPDSAGTDCTPIFSFFLEKVVNIAILELGLVSNERPGHFTFYKDIHEFLNPSIFVKIIGVFNFML